jgi:mono/diheme cytochrome c family protein
VAAALRIPNFLMISLTFAVAATAAAQSPATPDGANLYRNNCAACHGMAGEGDGPVASAMRVTLPNLRTLASRNDGEFPRDAVTAYIDGRTVPAAHGDRYMPVWGDVFGAGDDARHSDAEVARRIAAITEFVSQLQYRD